MGLVNRDALLDRVAEAIRIKALLEVRDFITQRASPEIRVATDKKPYTLSRTKVVRLPC
jgi:hypothetical protein